MNPIPSISPEEEHFLLIQDIDALSEEVIRGAWRIHSFEELNMVWKAIKDPTWSGTEELKKKYSWLLSKLKFQQEHLQGFRRSTLRKNWFMKNSQELMLRYLDSYSLYDEENDYWFSRHWLGNGCLSHENPFAQNVLKPIAEAKTPEEIDSMIHLIGEREKDYGICLTRHFKFWDKLDLTDLKLVRKLGGKKKAMAEAEKIDACNLYMRVVIVFVAEYVLDAEKFSSLFSEGVTVCMELWHHWLEDPDGPMRDCYFSAFYKYCPDCPRTNMSPYFYWKQAHPKEYNLFKNEAEEALLRAMYNYNHADAPAIVKFEPNYLDLDDNSMHVNPPAPGRDLKD